MGKVVDLTGRRFGRLLVMAYHPSEKKNARWLCRCDCGNKTIATSPNLKTGCVQSCGCLRREWSTLNKTKHGHRRGAQSTTEYEIWSSMIGRCRNKNKASYPRYGGRGITVCRRWHKFENFLADMGPRPAGLTLDRVNNDKGYSPSNCAWRTYAEQNAHRSTTRIVRHPDGEETTIAVAAKRLGVSYARLWYYLDKTRDIKSAAIAMAGPRERPGPKPRVKSRAA